MPEGTVVIETIISNVLRDNPLGDPFVRRVPVYLPPGYESGDARYPVAYVLTGFTGRGTMLLNDAAWDENIAQRMDRLIAEGKVRPMILVMPDCFTRIGGSQYINSSAVGRYEDHIVQELVPYFDAKYKTLADRDHRAVAGKSSGGYGSVMLATRNPDVFGLMASHSGDMYFEYGYKPDIIKALRALPKYGGLDKFWNDFPTMHPKSGDFPPTLNTIAMAACYSPNPNAPHGFDLPFDLETGELREDVWARWLEWDPVYLVDKYAEALRSLRLIYLDAGLRDEFNLQYGARIFVKRLKERGIPYVHQEFDDGHMGIQYRYDVSLKAISDAIPM
ncbi:MAG: esterase family protein [Chloroflexi bacterium]|nr:esterase family protein [Chloroflexota bacterium]